MKMRPTVSSDESISAAGHAGYSSRRPEEQISASKNVQTEYEAHLSQNAAYSSTYGPSATPLHQNVAHRERRVDDMREDQRDVTRNSEKREQRHKGVDTGDINSSRRHQSKLRLWCLRLCREKRNCSDCVLRKPRRLLDRRVARREKYGRRQPEDAVAVASVSTMSDEESISYRDVPKKSRGSRKRDETVEAVDRDVTEDVTREERKERKRWAREEKRRETAAAEERRERRERRKREERAPHFVDVRPVARDDDLVVEDRIVPAKPPSIADLAKNCCYLCAQNTLAIAAAAISRPSDKCVQVSAHKFHAKTSPATLDKSCSPLLLLCTVQSSVKARTRETGTPCPGASAAVPRAKKRKKFIVFPRLTRTKCPAGRHAVCETDKSTAIRRDDNAKKREPRNVRCCREKNP